MKRKLLVLAVLTVLMAGAAEKQPAKKAAAKKAAAPTPAEVTLPPWKNHHIRRTVRSNLSALKIPEEVREAVLAHVRPGIKGTYDKFDYFDQKRDALELWAARLRSIVEPPPPNVVALRKATAP